MSILEEASISTVMPVMGVFNNLVLYDQHQKKNSLQSIVPDLATSWVWNDDGTELSFRLRQGVKWHDGKLFTAKDVVCTWDLLFGKSGDKLRTNPRKSWYQNITDVAANGDDEVRFHLRRPQPPLLALLASGYSPIYPCHVSPREMRSHPIGTGPSDLWNSSRTNGSSSAATPITGSWVGPISTASNSRSFRTAQQRCWLLSPGSST